YLPLAAAATPPDSPTVIVIRNATILTVSHGTIERGSILIRDGKIAEVAQSINAPKDAQVIDAAGQFVMPAMIDCHSHIAADGIKFDIGEKPKRSNFSIPGQPRRYPSTRMGVEETIRGAFNEARDYKKTWEDYNKRFAAGGKNLIPPRRDLRLEPLVEVLEAK